MKSTNPQTIERRHFRFKKLEHIKFLNLTTKTILGHPSYIIQLDFFKDHQREHQHECNA